jgi:hypothetical protein
MLITNKSCTSSNREEFMRKENTNSNPALMIISCEHHEPTHHHKFASKPDTYVVIGKPNLSKLYQVKIKNNIKYLYVRCKDIYFSLPAKIIMAIEAFNNMKEFKHYSHFYKIDDDCKIDWNAVESGYSSGFLSHIASNEWSGVYIWNHTGKISNCSRHQKYAYQDPYNHWATNSYKGNGVKFLRGSNYCIARSLTNLINKIWHSNNLYLLLKTEVGEDVAIGKVCFLLNRFPSLIPKEDRFVIDEFNNEAS